MSKKVEQRINHNYYKQIADKIMQLLDKIHDSSLSSKRWVWELMQNAKDVPNKFHRVSVRIELWNDKLVFSHNGDHFTDGNITGLIQQVSSKHSANEGKDNQTGQFGTGFITTHLLSNVIDVNGVVKNPNTGQFQRFTLHLDRSARKSEDLIKNITDNLEWVKGLDRGDYKEFPIAEHYENRDEGSFDTSFTYHLNEESLRAAQVGLADLINTLPITMVSLHQIKSVEVIDHVADTKQRYTCENEIIDRASLSSLNASDYVVIIKSAITINEEMPDEKTANKTKYYLTYRAYKDEKAYKDKKPNVALSTETTYANGKCALVKRDKGQPVLFRDFPLIGSQDFHFPYTLNGFDFEPTENRNGILLNSGQPKPTNNRHIIDDAVDGVINFNEWLIAHGVANTYLLATSQKPVPQEPWDDDYAKPWINELQKSWRSRLLSQSLLETHTGYRKLSDIRIPIYGTKEANRKFYSFLDGFLTNGTLPLREQQDAWSEAIQADYASWGRNLKYTKDNFFKELEKIGNLHNLCSRLNRSESECYEWLNDLYAFVEDEGDEELLEKYSVIPNQEGDFYKLCYLSSDSDGRIPNLVKDISRDLLHWNLYEDLISEQVDDKVFKKKGTYTLQNLISDINNRIKKEGAKEDPVQENNWHVVSKGVYALLSLKTDNGEENLDKRDRMYAFVHQFAPDMPDQESIADLPSAIWDEADAFILKAVPSVVANSAKTLKELGADLLTYPLEHNAEECIAWINEYGQLCRNYNRNVPTKAKIYPNQNGDLRSLASLHYDKGIPEELKQLVHTATKKDWHAQLLDSRIKGYEQHDVLSTEDLYRSVKEAFENKNISEDRKLEIAQEAISLIPKSQEADNSDNKKLYALARQIADTLPESRVIEHAEGFSWEIFASYVLKHICRFIAESGNIENLSAQTNICEDEAVGYVDDVIEFAESRYGKRYQKYVEDEYGVWLNQNGDFCPYKGISKDGNINETLKEIARNEIVGNEYQDELLRKGMKCEYYISQTSSISNKDILNEIDEVIQQYVEDKGSFQNPQFCALVFKLNTLIKDNPAFKKDLKYFESNLNKLIVGTIDDPKTLETVGALVSDPNKLNIIEDLFSNKSSEKIRDFIVGKQTSGNRYGDRDQESQTSVKIEVQSHDSIAEIDIVDTPYAGLSKERMAEALLEAKDAVREELEQAGYEFTMGLCEDQYSHIDGVMKDGNEYPLVVHSYKDTTREFQLTAFDWDQLAKKNSMLWVSMQDGLKCVPFYSLVNEHGKLKISFDASNFTDIDRCKSLAEFLRYFKGLHFDFGATYPDVDDTIKMFNKPEKTLKEVLDPSDADQML